VGIPPNTRRLTPPLSQCTAAIDELEFYDRGRSGREEKYKALYAAALGRLCMTPFDHEAIVHGRAMVLLCMKAIRLAGGLEEMCRAEIEEEQLAGRCLDVRQAYHAWDRNYDVWSVILMFAF